MKAEDKPLAMKAQDKDNNLDGSVPSYAVNLKDVEDEVKCDHIVNVGYSLVDDLEKTSHNYFSSQPDFKRQTSIPRKPGVRRGDQTELSEDFRSSSKYSSNSKLNYDTSSDDILSTEESDVSSLLGWMLENMDDLFILRVLSFSVWLGAFLYAYAYLAEEQEQLSEKNVTA